MLSRFWNYITDRIRGSPANIATVAPRQAQPTKVHPHPPRSLLGLQSAQLHSAHERISVEYKLVLGKELAPQLSEEE